MNVEGLRPELAVEGAITAAVFEVCIEEVLAPKLRPEQVVELWTSSARTRASVSGSSSKLGAASYCTRRPSSAGLNPIEEAFSKLKSILYRAQVRGTEAMIEAMVRELDAITAGLREASSSTADTGHWVTYCDLRYRTNFCRA